MVRRRITRYTRPVLVAKGFSAAQRARHQFNLRTPSDLRLIRAFAPCQRDAACTWKNSHIAMMLSIISRAAGIICGHEPGRNVSSCFKTPQLARYGVINWFEMLIYFPCKLRFLIDLCLVPHSPGGFKTASQALCKSICRLNLAYAIEISARLAQPQTQTAGHGAGFVG